MTFLQALYGSQYQEIAAQGKDGNKGRFNGNLFLTAFIILFIFVIIAFLAKLTSVFSTVSGNYVQNLTGISSGKSAGRLLAIPLMFIVYIIVSKTIGTQKNFDSIVENFIKLPDEIRSKANSKVLKPFFILLILFVIMLVISL